jgi:ligand-binding sensor domain-containing protein
MKIYQLLILMCVACSCNLKIQQDKKSVQNGGIKNKVERNYNNGDVVTSALQDKNGNLWFGTSQDGIYRYDGTRLKDFTQKKND